MAALGYTPVSLYYSDVHTNTPSDTNLVYGELAINITDGKLFYKDNNDVVQVIASKATATGPAGSNTQIQFNNSGNFGASSGLTWDGTNLGVAAINGATSLTLKTGSTAAVTVSSTQKVGIGIVTPLATLHVVGGNSNNAVIDNGGQQYTTLSWYNNGTEKAQTYWDQTNTLFVSGTDVSAAYVFKTNGTERARIAGASGNMSIGTASTPIKFLVNGTDALGVPVGDTSQRPTGAQGYIRFNTDTVQFEGYNGTSWLSVGGAAISNDTTTSSNLYPLFANATTGSATTIYTSNAKYLYKPSTGELTSQAVVASNAIFVNSQNVSVDYTVSAGNNGGTFGPVTVNDGITVTVADGSTWTVV